MRSGILANRNTFSAYLTHALVTLNPWMMPAFSLCTWRGWRSGARLRVFFLQFNIPQSRRADTWIEKTHTTVLSYFLANSVRNTISPMSTHRPHTGVRLADQDAMGCLLPFQYKSTLLLVERPGMGYLDDHWRHLPISGCRDFARLAECPRRGLAGSGGA